MNRRDADQCDFCARADSPTVRCLAFLMNSAHRYQGLRAARRLAPGFSLTTPQPQAASHSSPSLPKKRSSCSPHLFPRPSAAIFLPSKRSSTSSCANGSTRAKSGGQSSCCSLLAAQGRSHNPTRPTPRRSSSTWYVPLRPSPASLKTCLSTRSHEAQW